MKFELEILKYNLNDVITTSGDYEQGEDELPMD